MLVDIRLVNIYIYIYIYVYIYIYIYIVFHRKTSVLSQLVNVARHAGLFKMGSKLAKLYVRLSILTLRQLVTYVSSGIITQYLSAFFCLHFVLPDTRVLNSLEELCITRVAAVNSFAWVLNPPSGVFFFPFLIKFQSLMLSINWSCIV